MCIKINRKVAFLSSTVGRKSQNIVVIHPSPPAPIFCHHSLKLLSSTLPKLMNWILLSPPPLSSDPDNPPKIRNAHRSNFCTVWEIRKIYVYPSCWLGQKIQLRQNLFKRELQLLNDGYVTPKADFSTLNFI